MPDATTDFTKNIPARISADQDKARAIGAVFLFRISGDGGGTWTLNCKDDVGVVEGEQGDADCTLELSAKDWETMSSDPSAATKLFFTGKLKVKGNVMLATKLQQILG